MVRGRILSRLAGEPEPRDELAAIVENLRLLLNSRQGAPTAPDFGMLDFSDLAHNYPGAIGILRRHILNQIDRFEPRLRDVSVHEVSTDEPASVRLQITARLANARGAAASVCFDTSIKPGAKVVVEGR